MPAAMTYTSLTSDLVAYLERGNSIDTTVSEQLPFIINNAERRIAREAKILALQTAVVSAMVAGTAVYAKPDRWRDTVSINFGTGTSNNTRNPLLGRSYEYLRTIWPDQTATGVPRFYADYGLTHWIFGPTPDAAYPFEVVYYQLPPLLDSTNETNILTQNMPQMLLYACLLEATPFLKNDARIPTWQAYYDRALQAATGEDMGRIGDRAATRTEA
jgi:hypothetical protein